jgi:hypothetical protein
MESPQPLTIDQSPFDKELNKDLEDSSAYPLELIDKLLVNSPSQISITSAVLHEENQMTLTLTLTLISTSILKRLLWLRSAVGIVGLVSVS